MSRPNRRAVRGALLAAAVALPAAGIGAQTAAATTYAYWSYWHKAPGATSWTYSGSGPYYYRPADGSVEGWHFVTGSGGPSDPPPRARGAYSALCTNSPKAAGVQVALILDFGSSVQKSCLTVPSGSSGSTVLTKAGANAHYNSSGLLCSIEGYPRSGCGQVVSAPPATPKAAPKPNNRPTTTASSAPSPAPKPATTRRSTAPVGPGPGTPVTGTGGTPGGTAATRLGRQASASPAAGSGTPSSAGASAGDVSARSGTAQESFAPVAQRGAPDQGGFPTGLAVGVGLIAAVGAGAAVAARRRRS